MKRAIIFVVLLFALVYCQDWEWSQTYHNDIESSGYDKGYKVYETADGGFLIIGTTLYDTLEVDSIHLQPVYQYFIIRTNEFGDVILKKMYCSDVGAVAAAFRVAEDTVFAFESLNILWINGNADSLYSAFLWPSPYLHSISGYAATLTNDRLWVMFASQPSDSGSAITLYKLTQTGEVLLTRDYYVFGDSVSGTVYPYRLFQTMDGGYILCGHPSFVMRLNTDFDTLWTIYPSFGQIISFTEIAENTFLCIGRSGSKIIVFKILDDRFIP
jgi:hypothetical protein